MKASFNRFLSSSVIDSRSDVRVIGLRVVSPFLFETTTLSLLIALKGADKDDDSFMEIRRLIQSRLAIQSRPNAKCNRCAKDDKMFILPTAKGLAGLVRDQESGNGLPSLHATPSRGG